MGYGNQSNFGPIVNLKIGSIFLVCIRDVVLWGKISKFAVFILVCISGGAVL